MTGLGDGEKEKHINTFKTYLPWSLGVIALLEQGSFKELYYHGDSESIAILNGFFEWIVFCAREEGFPIILEHIKRRNIQSRIVYTSKNNISSNILGYLEHRQYHIEEFMLHRGEYAATPYEYFFAKEQDVERLAGMQKKYCMEEVSWSFYQRSLKDFVAEYEEKVGDGRVFAGAAPAGCKVEIAARYMEYVKIGSVYTEREYRGRGLAKKCMQGVLQWCFENGVSPCLSVRRDNTAAKRLYLGCGFEKKGEVLYCINISDRL